MYNIYSHKDISFHELRKKREWLILEEIFLNYYSENVKKERVVVFFTVAAICVEQLILCVTCRVQKRYVIHHFFCFLI